MNKRRKLYRNKSSFKKKTRSENQAKLFKEIRKDVIRVNKRLTLLERKGYRSGTWSSKDLSTRLSTDILKAWKNRRVKISSSMNITQLKAVQRALDKFLRAKTSTAKGIRSVKDSTIESLEENFDMEDVELDRQDYEDIYSLFSSEEWKDLTQKMYSSDLIALMVDAREYNYSENEFLERLETLIELEDLDISNQAGRLYNKLMKQ